MLNRVLRLTFYQVILVEKDIYGWNVINRSQFVTD